MQPTVLLAFAITSLNLAASFTIKKVGSLHVTGTIAISRRRPCSYGTPNPPPRGRRLAMANIYDDWRSDAVVDTMPLDEDNVRICLEEFIESDYGQQMFGRHELPASYGITGSIAFVDIDGPEVILSLDGEFWHRRDTVLGRAAMWLNARMPEITDVNVADASELEDFENVVDDLSGEVLYVKDKRAEDFNGDRATMEYQGIDPDVRGPFPQGTGGLRPGGSMINPA